MGPGEPSAWVVRFAPLVPAGGRVLDLAAGGGRHSAFFADRGHPVLAVDRDVTGLSALGDHVEAREVDLETDAGWPLGDTRFAAVVVTNYLWRPILADVVGAVADDGVLLYETFSVGNERFGRPRNPDFLLRPGELLKAAKGLRAVAYECGEIAGERPRVVQRICAVGAAYGAPSLPV